MSCLCSFGKRSQEALVGRPVPPSNSSSTNHLCSNDEAVIKRKCFPDFVFAQVSGDYRPYLEVSVFGCPIVGLLDSGASRSLVGSSGYELLKRLGLALKPTQITCTVANGDTLVSLGYVTTPICLMDKTRIIDILVIPELPHRLILGVDFWMSMDIIPDLKQRVWHFSESDPIARINSVQSSSSLSPSQKEALDVLVAKNTQLMATSKGRTHLVQHEIELISGTKPIKQRYYAVSPAKQQVIDEEIKKMFV